MVGNKSTYSLSDKIRLADYMKKIILVLAIFILLFTGTTFATPFLVCDPYVPVGEETITSVEIRYTLNDDVVTQTGTYTVVGSYIQLYDFNGSISGMSSFGARWSDGSNWSEWGELIPVSKIIGGTIIGSTIQ